MGLEHSPGLYDQSGTLIRDAAYFRGLPSPHFPLEALRTTVDLRTAESAPENVRYLFCGHLTGHFGHFLFAMLSRLWALPQPIPDDLRLVLLNGVNAPDLFEIAFSRSIFEALGITPERFAAFRHPVRFRTIEVPVAGIEENHQGHASFADFCHSLGRSLTGDRPAAPEDRFAYLSKRRLTSGVHRIVNEEEFCEALETLGVEIISPETLSMQDQVRLWRDRPVMAGLSGSMLHTSLFVPNRAYVALNPEPWINSNQLIIDTINQNEARTLFPKQGFDRVPAEGPFAHQLVMKSPKRLASRFHQAMRAAKRRRAPPSPGARTGFIGAFLRRPAIMNS